jgi:GT2 family glycosyltransferase
VARLVLRRLARAVGMRYKAQAPSLSDYEAVRQRAHCDPGAESRRDAASTTMPLVSIITVVRNSAATLPRAIASIRAQTYKNIQYIVVDCGSTDGCIDIIQANADLIDTWISEKTGGIYDAINKGVALSRGDYIGFLNADDYYEPDQVAMAIDTALKANADWVFGDVYMHNGKAEAIRLSGDPAYQMHIRKTTPSIYQVTALARRHLFEEHGLFRTHYVIASDYDWFLRITCAGAIGVYNPLILAHMGFGGRSTTSQRLAIFEGFLIAVRNGYPLAPAVRHWALRWLYPNGVPEHVSRMIATTRRVLAPAKAVVRDVLRRSPDTPPATAAVSPHAGAAAALPDYAPIQPLENDAAIQAFVETRQQSEAFDEALMAELVAIGHLHQRFAIIGDQAACCHAKRILQAVCTPSQHGVTDADLVVIASSDISHRAAELTQKTVIVLAAPPRATACATPST